MKKYRWLLFSRIYACIQTNSFLFFLSKVPLLNAIIPSNVYKYRVPKYLAGIFGIVYDLVKSAIAGNLFTILAIDYIPSWLSGITNRSGWPDKNISITLFIIIICFVPGVYRSKIFTPTTEDYTFLNHFMMNPKIYYHYKIIKDFFMSGLLLLPAVIYLFRNSLLVTVLILTKLCFMAAGNVLFLSVYKKKRKLFGVKKRLLFSTVFILLTYGFFFFGIFSDITFKPRLMVALMIGEIVAIIVCCRYLLRFSEYKRIAVQYANKDVLMLKISVSTALSEDDTGIVNTDWEKNMAFFNLNQGKNAWTYIDSAFRTRYKKPISGFYRQAMFVNLALCLGVGLLIRFQVLSVSSSNILNYSPMVISFVLNMTFGRSYHQMCFRNMDMPMLYHHLYDASTVVKSMKYRYIYLLRNGLLSISSLILGLIILFGIGNINLSGSDFIKLCMVYTLIFAIFETYSIIVYYIIQPYSSDMSVRSPVFSILSIVEGLFGITVLFARKNVLQLIIPLIISFVVILAFFLIALKLSPKAFKLPYVK